MIFTAHVADVGLATVMRNPEPTALGLRSARLATPAPFSKSKLPAPQLGRAVMLACWDDQAAVDRFHTVDPLGQSLATGWHVTMELVRAVGVWPGLDDDMQAEAADRNVGMTGPTIAVTVGSAYLKSMPTFIKVNQGLEDQFIDKPGLWGTAMSNLRTLTVATLTIWPDNDAAASYMRSGAHGQAIKDHYRPAVDPTGHTFVTGGGFFGFRPLTSRGSVGGRNPIDRATVFDAA